jgi:NADPH:quinone reductase-like Zn-dependent oxidoreductase
MDGSGTVVARGARVRRPRVGAKVYGVSFDTAKDGFYAEDMAVPEQNVARVPDDSTSPCRRCRPPR